MFVKILTSFKLNVMDEQREQLDPQEMVNRIYGFTADMLYTQKMGVDKTRSVLIEKGLRPEDADTVINNLQNQYKQEKKEEGNTRYAPSALYLAE